MLGAAAERGRTAGRPARRGGWLAARWVAAPTDRRRWPKCVGTRRARTHGRAARGGREARLGNAAPTGGRVAGHGPPERRPRALCRRPRRHDRRRYAAAGRSGRPGARPGSGWPWTHRRPTPRSAACWRPANRDRCGCGTAGPAICCSGTEFVRADGTIAHSGGRVVKNVAGYDLGKLLAGSWGTLALITTATLRRATDADGPRLGHPSGAQPDGGPRTCWRCWPAESTPAAIEVDLPIINPGIRRRRYHGRRRGVARCPAAVSPRGRPRASTQTGAPTRPAAVSTPSTRAVRSGRAGSSPPERGRAARRLHGRREIAGGRRRRC